MADIADVYTWMTSDAAKVNLAMTVSPADMGTNAFGPSIQYVWHATSHPGASNGVAFGAPGTESRVICTFASNTSAQCWVVQGTTVKEYVKGDPSTAMTSSDGKMKVFAGRRSDPFFFNLGGFLIAQNAVETAAAALTFDAAGCPQVPALTAAALRNDLSTAPAAQVGPCAANQIDCFKNFNVMAIVVQVDKSLLLQSSGSTSDHLLSVWGSTHAKP
ncbi:MAG TPA: DUF4331 family protein [Kofleriaceae bacterium]